MLSTPVVNLSSKTLALDYENNEDVPDDGEEQYYEEPDLSGGVEGVDYGIIYGIVTRNQTPKRRIIG
jgi:hypothetical protein